MLAKLSSLKMADNVNVDNLSLEEKDGNKTEILEETPTSTQSCKIDILLKAAGDAPIMKQKKWVVDQNKTIGWVIECIKKYLKIGPTESLFLYVNQCFAPSPDHLVRNLYNCFGTDGKLVLHYCKTPAWG